MNIRKATTSDVKEIQSLILSAAEPDCNVDFDDAGRSHFKKPNETSSIKSRVLNEEYLILCYVQNEKIVGMIAIHESEKVDQLFVDPSFRNQGISKQL